ncbi:putative membrane protein [Clostridioides difficile CD160]|nr:putative membrane protein [Clostridioides difficile CD160]
MSNFIKDNKKGISIIIVIVLFILFGTCPIDLLQAVLSS